MKEYEFRPVMSGHFTPHGVSVAIKYLHDQIAEIRDTINDLTEAIQGGQVSPIENSVIQESIWTWEPSYDWQAETNEQALRDFADNCFGLEFHAEATLPQIKADVKEFIADHTSGGTASTTPEE